jgi:hypothetical protein
MSQKFIVCAIDRKSQGLDFIFRAGRGWPGGAEVEIEVLDQSGDVFLENGKLDPKKMGKAAWETLKADKRISWRPFGALTEAQALPLALELQATNAGLTKELDGAKEAHGELVAKVAELETVLTAAREEADYASSLLKENEELKAKVAELTATLESLTAPAPKGDVCSDTPVKPESDAPKGDNLPKAKSKAVK